MKLELEFESIGGKTAWSPSYLFGLKTVKEIRAIAGCELPISRIDNYAGQLFTDIIKIDIGEEIAERSGHFEYWPVVRVFFPPFGLDRFIDETIYLKRSPNTDEIISARIEKIVNTPHILSEWEKAGFPLRWNTIKEEANK